LPFVTPKELRSRRIALGLTVQDLARELDLTTTELQQMEDGVMPAPQHALLADVLSRVENARWRDCLVVEDDDSVRELFASRLRAEGLTVDEAADGLAAMDATAARDYRLLLLDLKLPKVSGHEVLDHVAKKPTRPANVIIISAAGAGEMEGVVNHRAVSAILRKRFAITNADVVFPALAALARA
jgi:CheY-like chemotaxis protein/DNA-binding XRE family transcriptional regulator